jgi:hypothetical protein
VQPDMLTHRTQRMQVCSCGHGLAKVGSQAQLCNCSAVYC